MRVPRLTLPALTVALLTLPVGLGLFYTLAPALGLIGPPGPAPFMRLGDWPGIGPATRLSLTTGFAATVLSLAITALIAAGWQGTRAFALLQRLLSPLLSVPHAAAAFGLAFLIAPSGWLARAFSPWLTGWNTPPDLLIVQDGAGLALIAGLTAKEVPFLLLMLIAARSQTRSEAHARVATTLGYPRATGWLLVAFPSLYAQIRLPVYVVLAYSMSVVDVAMILGPNTPPTLAVQITRWMADPDLSLRAVAAAGALWQLALVLGGLTAWRAAEALAARAGVALAMSGHRLPRLAAALRAVGLAAGLAVAASVLAGLSSQAVWSVAGYWSFPESFPDALDLRTWARHGPMLWPIALTTLLVAATAAFAALALVVGCLETEARHGLRIGRTGRLILYLPLLIPQIAFLPGLQALMLSLGLREGLWPVMLSHLTFVLPYTLIALSGPYHAIDRRLFTAAAALGASPARRFLRLRLPLLLAPLLTALAVGFAVSVGQYLPTLLLGGGRVTTLTTEAVALTSGGDRRAIGAYALAQTGAALLPFALALAIPRLMFANRKGMRGG
ncbi:ABC transporter permease [Vannielia litorea]|uniref:Putative thiamine transport system permease protein n=1 Tax=Vannielia litorea TaxID=1217970 RepID=A0A1N6FNB1_9RHOB|nr:ABC transporter permease subunit [Vannielia litorea]SIN96775.1 putative thiamine transport system permease protein [Vannielia litorea]